MARHEKEILLTRHQLVDPYHYLPYLHDDPLLVPTERTSAFDVQHMYFPAPKFRAEHKNPSKKIHPWYLKLGRSTYSQLYMTDDEEERYHQDHAVEVPYPPLDVAEQYALEVQLIDELGGLSMAVNPRNYSRRLTRTRTGKRERDAMLTFASEAREESAARLFGQVEVMPHSIAVSAVKRLAIKLSDPILHELAYSNLQPGETYFPVRTFNFKSLMIVAKGMFKDNVELTPVVFEPVLGVD